MGILGKLNQRVGVLEEKVCVLKRAGRGGIAGSETDNYFNQFSWKGNKEMEELFEDEKNNSMLLWLWNDLVEMKMLQERGESTIFERMSCGAQVEGWPYMCAANP